MVRLLHRWLVSIENLPPGLSDVQTSASIGEQVMWVTSYLAV